MKNLTPTPSETQKIMTTQWIANKLKYTDKKQNKFNENNQVNK